MQSATLVRAAAVGLQRDAGRRRLGDHGDELLAALEVVPLLDVLELERRAGAALRVAEAAGRRADELLRAARHFGDDRRAAEEVDQMVQRVGRQL